MSFENDLTAMFDAAPALDDAPAFAIAVEAALQRRMQWRARVTAAAVLVGGAGAVWGLSVLTMQGFDLGFSGLAAAARAGSAGIDPATGWLLLGAVVLGLLALPSLTGAEDMRQD